MIVVPLYALIGVPLARQRFLLGPIALIISQSVTTAWALVDLAAIALAGLVATAFDGGDA